MIIDNFYVNAFKGLVPLLEDQNSTSSLRIRHINPEMWYQSDLFQLLSSVINQSF